MPARAAAATQSRLRHGERTRQEILEVAVRLAATEGLEGLTIGRLAERLGMSKGGVFAHFGSKESMQLAVVDLAAEAFLDEVAGPAMEAPAGTARLRAMIGAYFAYLERRRTSGGCFFTGVSFEMDDRPGPVRDRLREIAENRRAFIEQAIAEAIAAGELPKRTDPAQLAFEVGALLAGANLEAQLFEEPQALERARTTVERWLEERAIGPAKKLSARRKR